jgi:hypothetical protein
MMMVHRFGKMEHLGKFNLGKTMDKMRWNIGKFKYWMICGPNKMEFLKDMSLTKTTDEMRS